MSAIKLPQPTQDQAEYLERIRAAVEHAYLTSEQLDETAKFMADNGL